MSPAAKGRAHFIAKSPPDPFDPLSGRTSLTGRRWRLADVDNRNALALAQTLNAPDVVGRVLAARGISIDDAPGFLQPKLKHHLPDPLHLKDMDKAASRIAAAVMNDERIAIFGDYDVDGATSSAVLKRFLEAAGARVTIYIPDRQKEGYGPNAPALLKLKEDGAALAITVDCGQLAFEPLQAAQDAGLDVIVFDHHKGEAREPAAVAVVNPNRVDDDSPHGQLAAVGVAFLGAIAVHAKLRDAGWYSDRNTPDLMALLDVVALGTVADVVPLTGVNRALVSQGLKVMAARGNIGLRALSDIAGIKERPTAYHLGFVLGPRINAGGRVGASDLGARLLTTPDEIEALAIADRLDQFNRERQDIEAQVLEAAIAVVESKLAGGEPGPLILATGKDWHPGVIGIVASRLKERYNRPACVLSLSDGKGTGSGRSISGADLGAAIIAAVQQGLLIKGGGHAMAAGFSVEEDKLDAFEEFLSARMEDALGPNPEPPALKLDGVVSVGGANVGLIQTLDAVGPFGVGNPEPRFILKNVTIVKADPVGKDQSHVRLILTDGAGGRLTAIAFRAQDSALGAALLKHAGAPFHFAGKLRMNSWQGRDSAQLQVEDAVKAWD